MQLTELSDRAREVFRLLIEDYLQNGQPVGSKSLAGRMNLSSASIRHVLAELEGMGLLAAPHTSAGRLPTHAGLRLFVDGLLEVGDLTDDQRTQIQTRATLAGQSLNDVLTQTTTLLADLAACTGLVIAPKTDAPLKQLDFVLLQPGQTLVVLVMQSGLVENRVIQTPPDITPAQLQMAANYLNSKMADRNLADVRQLVLAEIAAQKAQLDEVSARLVQSGLAVWSGLNDTTSGGQLIVKGHAHLLKNVQALHDLEKIRTLFDALETKETLLNLVNATSEADGVKIFIGAEHPVFSESGCSLIVAPFGRMGAGPPGAGHMVGAVGVIGPARLNYARVVPLVDYTAKLMDVVLGRAGAHGKT